MITVTLTKEQLQELFRKFCKHFTEYKRDRYFSDVWQNCSACVLGLIPWNQGHCERDLCFAIWHEDILGKEL